MVLKMYVYFIAVTDAHPNTVKIGKAKNPMQRLIEMQTGCPYQLKLVGQVPCLSEKHAYQVETNAHIAFRDFAYRGEWFRYTDRVRRAISTIIMDTEFNGSEFQFYEHLNMKSKGYQRLIEQKEDWTRGEQLNAEMDREFGALMRNI